MRRNLSENFFPCWQLARTLTLPLDWSVKEIQFGLIFVAIIVTILVDLHLRPDPCHNRRRGDRDNDRDNDREPGNWSGGKGRWTTTATTTVDKL